MFTTADNFVVQIHRPLEEPAALARRRVQPGRRHRAQAGHPRLRLMARRRPSVARGPCGGRPRAGRGPHPAGRPHLRAAARRRPRPWPTSCPAATACWPAPAAPPRRSPSSTRRSRSTWLAADGDAGRAGQSVVGTVSGPLASILTAERTALNFLGHLSGIATLTRRFVDAAAEGGPARIWDTRKTTPGLRAPREGGGARRRRRQPPRQPLGLGDAQGQPPRRCWASPTAVAAARATWPGRTVHVECGTLDQVRRGPRGRRRRPAARQHDARRGRRRASAWPTAGRPTTAAAARCSSAAVASPSRPSPPTRPPASTCSRTSQITSSAPVLDIGLDIRTMAAYRFDPSSPGS